jgi:hypothetical protein
VEDCLGYFEQLAELAFPRRSSCIRWLWQLRVIARSLFTDSIYPADALERILQEVFGTGRGILDSSHAITAGTKIGITVSSIKPEPFLFTNYNGLGDRQDKKYRSYSVLVRNALVWEM